jgi:hypothetical protein
MSRAVEGRLDRMQRRLRAAALDAQARDWAAERPDQVGFARLWEVHGRIQEARNRAPFEDRLLAAASLAAWPVTSTALLLATDEPAAPLTLTLALAAGLAVAEAVTGGAVLVRRWRGRRERARPAPIDDPGLYAELRRELEQARADARAAGDQRRAEDLGQALAWLDAAVDELTSRTSSATR